VKADGAQFGAGAVQVAAGSVSVLGGASVSGTSVKFVELSLFDQPLNVVDASPGTVAPAVLATHEPVKKFELFVPEVSALTVTVSAGLF
jgi:hypothetical protein